MLAHSFFQREERENSASPNFRGKSTFKQTLPPSSPRLTTDGPHPASRQPQNGPYSCWQPLPWLRQSSSRSAMLTFPLGPLPFPFQPLPWPSSSSSSSSGRAAMLTLPLGPLPLPFSLCHGSHQVHHQAKECRLCLWVPCLFLSSHHHHHHHPTHKGNRC